MKRLGIPSRQRLLAALALPVAVDANARFETDSPSSAG
jgi:hypothetical protein